VIAMRGGHGLRGGLKARAQFPLLHLLVLALVAEVHLLHFTTTAAEHRAGAQYFMPQAPRVTVRATGDGRVRSHVRSPRLAVMPPLRGRLPADELGNRPEPNTLHHLVRLPKP
jgi:hypothetical protein